MARVVAAVTDTLGACWVLLTLAARSRLRFRSRYWRWRVETAFPSGRHPEGLLAAARDAFGYAKWAWRVRRLR